MGFVQDLGKALDDLLGQPPGTKNQLGFDNLIPQGQGDFEGELSLEGIMPQSSAPLSAPGNSPHDMDATDLLAIQQRRTKAFQVFDISPYHCDPNTFPCQIPSQALYDKVGYEKQSTALIPSAAGPESVLSQNPVISDVAFFAQVNLNNAAIQALAEPLVFSTSVHLSKVLVSFAQGAAGSVGNINVLIVGESAGQPNLGNVIKNFGSIPVSSITTPLNTAPMQTFTLAAFVDVAPGNYYLVIQPDATYLGGATRQIYVNAVDNTTPRYRVYNGAVWSTQFGVIPRAMVYTVFATPNSATTTAQGWRTFQIPAVGDFLKIEFMPSRFNYIDQDGVNEQAQFHEDFSGPPIAQGTPTQNIAQGDSQTQDNEHATFAPTNPPIGLNARDHSHQILLQFDDSNGPILIAKDGDTFHAPFQTAYVTFQWGCPRFTIITGFGTEIRESPAERLLASNPAFGPGHGLWTNPKRHCTPFTFTQGSTAGQSHSIYYVGGVKQVGGGLLNLAAGNTYEQDLFKMYDDNTVVSGIGIGWITNINLSAIPQTLNPADAIALDLWLVIRPFGSNQPQTTPTSSFDVEKIIAHAGGIGIGRVQETKVHPFPKRFVLKKGDTLTLRIATSNNIDFQYSIDGYVFGQLNHFFKSTSVPQSPTGGNIAPPYTLEALTINPFPLDTMSSNYPG